MNNLIKLKAKTDNIVNIGQIVEGQIMFGTDGCAYGSEMIFCFYDGDKWVTWPLDEFEPA